MQVWHEIRNISQSYVLLLQHPNRPKQNKAHIVIFSFKAFNFSNLGGKLIHYPWITLWLLLGKQSNQLFVSLDDCGRAGNQLCLICFVKEDGRGNILPPSPPQPKPQWCLVLFWCESLISYSLCLINFAALEEGIMSRPSPPMSLYLHAYPEYLSYTSELWFSSGQGYKSDINLTLDLTILPLSRRFHSQLTALFLNQLAPLVVTKKGNYID